MGHSPHPALFRGGRGCASSSSAPFDLESAIAKVQAAEDAWFITGRAEIVGFLTAKWEREGGEEPA